jgi:hypothetical protein
MATLCPWDCSALTRFAFWPVKATEGEGVRRGKEGEGPTIEPLAEEQLYLIYNNIYV